MSADTPIPFTPPEGTIITTMASARHVGRGQVAYTIKAGEIVWRDVGRASTWIPEMIVWWRPTPERVVTIELPESEVRRIADTCWWSETGDDVVHAAARAAVAQLDDDK